jgi:hypothetical protein
MAVIVIFAVLLVPAWLAARMISAMTGMTDPIHRRWLLLGCIFVSGAYWYHSLGFGKHEPSYGELQAAYQADYEARERAKPGYIDPFVAVGATTIVPKPVEGRWPDCTPAGSLCWRIPR